MAKISVFTRQLAVTAAFLLPFGVCAAESPQENGAAFAPVLTAVQANDWTRAADLAAANADPIAVELVDWMRLRAGQGHFAEYEQFLTENADWPGLPLMQKASEAGIPAGLAPARLQSYFAVQPPQTATGVLRLADALRRDGQIDAGAALIATSWQGMAMDAADEEALRSAWPDVTAANDAARLDWYLWEKNAPGARRLLDRVDAASRSLAETRLALQENTNGVDGMIARLSAAQIASGGLARDRYDWRMRNGFEESAQDLFMASSASAAALGRPAYWAGTRRSLARQVLRAGQAARAYQLASQHHLPPHSDDFDDLEWLAGYIALDHLDQPAQAVTHFTRFRDAVRSPISLGRAGYWLGRAEQAAGQDAAAAMAFALGAQYQTSFYGQLAAIEGGLDPDPSLSGPATPPEWYAAEFLQHDSVRAAILLYFAGDVLQAHRFMAHESESLSPDAAAQLGQLALEMSLPHAALNIAKNAARNGDTLIGSYYPVLDLPEMSLPVPLELALSIMRQESEFYGRAVSGVGARGLMQVMPDTAREVAAALNLGYDSARMLNDPGYNIQIGSAYLATLLTLYDGSYLLATAAYNAGPSRVERWLAAYGDPRTDGVDPILWAESIPFTETRNYVQRVMEAVFVYRARTTGQVGALTLRQDLFRGHR